MQRATIPDAILLLLKYRPMTKAGLKQAIGCPKIGGSMKRLRNAGLIKLVHKDSLHYELVEK